MSDWDPSKHPRKPKGSSDGGEFASVNGGSAGAFISAEVRARLSALSRPAIAEKMHTTKLNADPPEFVIDFSRRFPSIAERKDYLKTSSLDKLSTAHRLLGSRLDASSSLMRSLVEQELASRKTAK